MASQKEQFHSPHSLYTTILKMAAKQAQHDLELATSLVDFLGLNHKKARLKHDLVIRRTHVRLFRIHKHSKDYKEYAITLLEQCPALFRYLEKPTRLCPITHDTVPPGHARWTARILLGAAAAADVRTIEDLHKKINLCHYSKILASFRENFDVVGTVSSSTSRLCARLYVESMV